MLIPKSKPTFQKFSTKISENLSRVPRFWCSFLATCLGCIKITLSYTERQTTRVEVPPPFNAKLCEISGNFGKFFKKKVVNAVKLHKSDGECGKKTLSPVDVKLHNFTADLSWKFT